MGFTITITVFGISSGNANKENWVVRHGGYKECNTWVNELEEDQFGGPKMYSEDKPKSSKTHLLRAEVKITFAGVIVCWLSWWSTDLRTQNH